MPEDIKPPKTIEEVGVHLTYMAKAQNTTIASLCDLNNTLRKIQLDTVSRSYLDKHVVRLEDRIGGVEKRLGVLEDVKAIEDASVLTSLKKKTINTIISAFSIAIVAGLFLMIFIFVFKANGVNVNEIDLKTMGISGVIIRR